MSAADRLNQIEARANAATEGPWEADPLEGNLDSCQHERHYRERVAEVGMWRDSDADFIAHARTDLPDLVAALRAVLDEIDKRKGTVGGRLTLADVLPLRIEEALS